MGSEMCIRDSGCIGVPADALVWARRGPSVAGAPAPPLWQAQPLFTRAEGREKKTSPSCELSPQARTASPPTMPSSTRSSPGTKETPSSCCTPCCVCCSCCIKPALIAALGLLDKEIDEIVAQKIVALAPTSEDMVRDTYSAPSKKGKSKVPKAPPLAKFEAWERAKAAIVVQKNYRGHAQKLSLIHI